MLLDTFSFPTYSLLPNHRYYILVTVSNVRYKFIFSFRCTLTNTAAMNSVYEHDLEEIQ